MKMSRVCDIIKSGNTPKENGIAIETFRKVHEKSNDVLRDAMIEVLYGE